MYRESIRAAQSVPFFSKESVFPMPSRWMSAPVRLKESVAHLPQALNRRTFATGLLMFMSIMSIQGLLILQAVELSGWSQEILRSWYFGSFFTAGLFGVLMSLLFKQPIPAAVPVTVVALLTQTLPSFSPQEAVGGYIVGGGIIILVGISGLFGRFLALIPRAVVMGMLCGVLLHFGVAIYVEWTKDIIPISATLVVFLITHRWFRKTIPPLAAALVMALVMAVWQQNVAVQPLHWAFVMPQWIAPQFTLSAVFSIALPVVLLSLSAHTATGVSVLRANQYNPPTNLAITLGGLLSVLGAFIGASGISMAAPRSAIAVDASGEANRDLRYGSVTIDGMLLMAAGIVSPVLGGVFGLLPIGAIKAIAGLALLPVIANSLRTAFSKEEGRPMGAIFALLIAASNTQWLGIGSAFWALCLAPMISQILDTPPAKK